MLATLPTTRRRLDYQRKTLIVSPIPPIGYWPQGEPSGSVALDVSGNGRHGAYTGVTLGGPGRGDGQAAASFNGSTSYNNIYSSALSTAFNGSKGTISLWFAAADPGVWSDGVSRYLIDFLAVDGSGNYRVSISKNTTATITLAYVANGTNKAVSVSNNTSTAWMHWAMTWDSTADEVKAYLNGVRTGSTQTGLGVWNQVALFSTFTTIGAASTAAANVWNGRVADAAVWSVALPPGAIAELYAVGQSYLPYSGYLLQDQFTTNASAPLTTPRTCEPGPNTLTLVDTNSIISIASQRLTINGTAAANDRVVATAIHGRKAGRAFLVSAPTITTVVNTLRLGLDTSQNNTTLENGIDYSSTTAVRIKTSTSVIGTITLGAAPHDYAFVMRGTGGFLFWRASGSGAYTLLWVYNTGTADLYSRIIMTGVAANNITLDDWRIIDLAGGFTSDNGIATAASANPVANDTLSCNADCILEFTWTTPAASGTIDLLVRRSSDSDCWIVRGDQAGSTIKLIEKVAGVETERSSVAMTWTALTAFRIVITCDTQTIASYVADVAKNSYTSAATQQTTAGAKTTQAGANFISWPRTVTING